MRRFATTLLLFLTTFMPSTVALAHNASGLPPGPPPAMPEIKGQKVSLGRLSHLDHGTTIMHNKNFPGTIYVAVGETVTFVNEGVAPHTVTFLADRDPRTLTEADLFAPTQPSGAEYDGGFFSTGVLEFMHSFELTFTAPGVYTYICAIHPGMSGTVVVMPSGVALPSQAQQQQVADAEHHQHAAIGAAVDAAAANQPPVRIPNGDGTLTWVVQMGASADLADTLAFYPNFLRIRAGDSLLFQSNSPVEPHSASVHRPEDLFVLGDGPFGLNPALLAPNGNGQVEDESDFEGTGIIFPGMPDATLTFTKPGVYHIHCDLHDALGMVMTVIVAEADAIDLYVNDQSVEGALFKDGHLFAPIRAIAEQIGADLAYDPATRTVTVTTHAGHDCAVCPCHCDGGQSTSSKVYLNGQALDAGYETKAFIAPNGRMYGPVAAWAAILGGTFRYDAETGQVWLNLAEH